MRWLGRVTYDDALALQHRLFDHGRDDWLLLLEHPHVYTLGRNGQLDHVLVDPATVGAELVRTDRGGDVTYHGPGQLVGYPILTVPGKRGGGMTDTVAYVSSIEQLVIDALTDLGLCGVGRLAGYPGVWVEPHGPEPRKIAAVGVRLTRGRSMHGFALNVAPDMDYFGHIVPCGIEGKGVTSLAEEGVDCSMREVVDAVASRAAGRFAGERTWDRADVAWHVVADDLAPFTREAKVAPGETSVRMQRRLTEAGVTQSVQIKERLWATSSPEDALELCRYERPDVMLCDALLADREAWHSVVTFLRRQHSVPIMLLDDELNLGRLAAALRSRQGVLHARRDVLGNCRRAAAVGGRRPGV